jgi:hypothetical protein
VLVLFAWFGDFVEQLDTEEHEPQNHL